MDVRTPKVKVKDLMEMIFARADQLRNEGRFSAGSHLEREFLKTEAEQAVSALLRHHGISCHIPSVTVHWSARVNPDQVNCSLDPTTLALCKSLRIL